MALAVHSFLFNVKIVSSLPVQYEEITVTVSNHFFSSFRRTI